MAGASPKQVKRLKKLVALSASPNEHEAARARELAGRFMARHGLTLADAEDDVVEVADDQRDHLRLQLAFAVGVSRRCVVIGNNRGELAFKGSAAGAKQARALYQALVGDATAHCEIGPNDPGRAMWRLYFWLGYVKAVVERLIDDEARAWTPPRVDELTTLEGQPAKAIAKPRDLEDQLAHVTVEFAAHHHPAFAQLGVELLRQEALASGREHGLQAHIEPREPPAATNRALGEGQEEAS